MAGAASITINCPAKVNLALSVGQPGSDGLHPIASWMVTIDFADTLHLEAVAGATTAVQIAFAADAPRPEKVCWPIEDDLAARAHRLLQRETGHPLPVRAVLSKRIPTGAGLGGGSSDAAAMLVGLDRLFGLELTAGTRRNLAMELGSDVVFLAEALATGRGSALVAGTGDQVELLAGNPGVHLVLILPTCRNPTGPVYRAFDRLSPTAEVDPGRVRVIAEGGAHGMEHLFNDLTEAAMVVNPVLRQVRNRAGAVLDRPVHITGSGAAMFASMPDRPTADAAAVALRKATGLAALAASSCHPLVPAVP